MELDFLGNLSYRSILIQDARKLNFESFDRNIYSDDLRSNTLLAFDHNILIGFLKINPCFEVPRQMISIISDIETKCHMLNCIDHNSFAGGTERDLYISRLAISSKLRNRGYGKSLVEEGLKIFKKELQDFMDKPLGNRVWTIATEIENSFGFWNNLGYTNLGTYLTPLNEGVHFKGKKEIKQSVFIKDYLRL